jgi:hypothetical protein
VRPDRVVEVAEAVDFDGEGVAVADVGTVEVFVLQGAEEPFDDAVGLGWPCLPVRVPGYCDR